MSKKSFSRHRSFGHRPIIPRHSLHSSFFFGHRAINVPRSSVVIWSNPGTTTGYTVSPPESIVDVDGALETPLITIMLRNRHELDLLLEQVQELENLREGYQREAIRCGADIRIAEMDLQKLLRADTVDLELVQGKLQEIEHLKVELRLARIRAIEQAKTLLSPEQHSILQALLAQSRYSELRDERSSPVAKTNR